MPFKKAEDTDSGSEGAADVDIDRPSTTELQPSPATEGPSAEEGIQLSLTTVLFLCAACSSTQDMQLKTNVFSCKEANLCR